jgi:hypothetical protein
MKTILPVVCDELIKLLEDGNTIKTPCGVVGIDESTFYDWINKGDAGKADYAKFAKSVKKARAKAQAYHVSVIKKASEENWQASAWYLERSDPDHWARTERIKTDVNQVEPIRVILEKIPGRDANSEEED